MIIRLLSKNSDKLRHLTDPYQYKPSIVFPDVAISRRTIQES